MKIVILGLTSEDVGAEYRPLSVLLGDSIGVALAGQSIPSKVQTLFYTPIIMRPEFGPFPDKISYLRSEPGVNASINVSYQLWTEGDRADRVNLLVDALFRVIDQIKESKISAEAKAQLRKIIEDVRHELTHQPLH